MRGGDRDAERSNPHVLTDSDFTSVASSQLRGHIRAFMALTTQEVIGLHEFPPRWPEFVLHKR